ncbi:MAG: aminodeoxychorismate/anthranilate synthase component II [Deltaproteobacteria bacterium]|nr:aminodeoxychorismate/anthranilate synthase component II [Deltaproteobacteria bacterium]
MLKSILLIDNFDSFTFNLVQYLGELGAQTKVIRNNEWSSDQIQEFKPDGIVISPGPCTPDEAGISVEVVQKFGASIPILGVCLGHQSIGQAYGGKVIRAPEIMHGKTSKITHNNQGVFCGLENPFVATRYHSLIVDQKTLPDCLEITAQVGDLIMGLKHKTHPVQGVQFHPESILTTAGLDLLRNFLNQKKEGC